jgi:acyl-CoA thioester hydrolase
MAPFRHSLRVRYPECDAQNVVYFARYPEYFDLALTEMWRESMGSYQSMVDGGTDLVVAEMAIRYRAPARFDEVIEVEISIDRLGETSIATTTTIRREDETLVEGNFRHVFIDPPTKAKKQIPDDIRAALEPYVADQTASRSASTTSQPESVNS